ncbi:thermonuclease family protein [Nocardioides sp. Bht2]|uniref:thermonuclease family protein n=1 Tax=Nocardioides sp. Bht2 TaxID=3392297 RepID=UPI0039B5DC5D
MRRTTILTALLGLLATALTAFGVGAMTAPASAYDRDCGDFANQRDAQIFFLNAGGPHSDPHRLDADGDGVACDSNPCPCYYGTTKPGDPPKGDGKKPKKKTVVQYGRIIRVTDGDTVKVRLNGGGTKNVRLIGIDTPEVYGGTECWGPQASHWLKKRLPKGTRVKLTSDPTQELKDRYGRLLRYVTKRSSGKDLNYAQVRAGNARVYVYGGKPFKRTKAYKKAQSSAKSRDAGLWGAC